MNRNKFVIVLFVERSAANQTWRLLHRTIKMASSGRNRPSACNFSTFGCHSKCMVYCRWIYNPRSTQNSERIKIYISPLFSCENDECTEKQCSGKRSKIHRWKQYHKATQKTSPRTKKSCGNQLRHKRAKKTSRSANWMAAARKSTYSFFSRESRTQLPSMAWQICIQMSVCHVLRFSPCASTDRNRNNQLAITI